MQADSKPIKVFDQTTKKDICMLFATTNEKLSQIRADLINQQSLKGKAFVFLFKGGMNTNESQQKKTCLHTVIKDDILTIQTSQIQVKQESNVQKGDKVISQYKKTNQQIDLLLGQLHDFSEKYKNQAKQKIQEKRNDLQRIHQKLDGLKIKCQFPESINPNDIITGLKAIQKDNDSFIQRLKAIKPVTPQQIIGQFNTTICKGRYQDKHVNINIVDFKKTKLNFDQQAIGYSQNQREFSTKDQQKIFQQQYKEKINSGQLNVAALTPWAVVNAGVDYSRAQQRNTAKQQNHQSSEFYKMFYGVYIGAGVIFNQDNIKLQDNVIQQYTNILKEYNTQNQNIDVIIIRIQEFLGKYGIQIECGTYLLGNTFKLDVQLKFQKKQNYQRRCYVASQSLKTALSAGGVFGWGLGGLQASFNLSGAQGKSGSDMKQKVKLSCSRKIESNPPVKSIDDWKQLVTLDPTYWKVVGVKKNFVDIAKIMRNKLNQNEIIKQAYQNNTIYQFQELLRQIQHVENKDSKTGPKDNKNVDIAVIGPTGVGKSTFLNQIIGQGFDQPFTTSDNVDSETYQINKIERGRYNFYDTPGLFDNTRKFKTGQLAVKICQLVNAGLDVDHKNYKKINCFLIVTKPNPRVQLQQSLLKLIQMFGVEALKSSIFVFNYQNQQEIEKNKEQILKNASVQALREKCLTFDFNRQIFFNYRLAKNKPFPQQKAQYAKLKYTLYESISKLPQYNSDDYVKFLDKRKKTLQNPDEAKADQEYQKDKNNKEEFRKQSLKKFISNELSFFTLKNCDSNKYIGHGKVKNFNGFILIDYCRLTLKNLTYDLEKGCIYGNLYDSWHLQKGALNFEGGLIGCSQSSNDILKVCIKFQQGYQSMQRLKCGSSQQKVKISFDYQPNNYWGEQNGILARKGSYINKFKFAKA